MSERSFGRETKFQQVRAGLETLAHQLGPDAQFPSVRALAGQFGTGLNTLSGALDDLEARDIVYRRQGVGVFVSPSLSRTMCFLVSPDFFARGHSPFWDSLLKAARLRSERGGEKFELHFAQSSEHLGSALEDGLANRISEGRVSGVIGVGLREEAANWIGAQNVPFVSLFGPSKGAWGVSVLFDTFNLIEQGVSHLSQNRCKKIEFWTTVSPETTRAHLEARPDANREKFFEILGSRGIERASSAWRTVCDDLAPHQKAALSPSEQGFEIARRVFSKPRDTWPDGIFCGEDILTHGALMGLQSLGIEVGRDVQIITHANSDSSIFLGHQVPLWLLEYDVNEVVEIVHDALSIRFGSELPPNSTDTVLLVAPHLRPLNL